MANRFGLPNLGIGLGLRTVHYSSIIQEQPAVAWFEILSENYLRTQGRPRERNRAHRGGADSRFGTGAEAFFTVDSRGDGSLRSQGRPAETSCAGR